MKTKTVLLLAIMMLATFAQTVGAEESMQFDKYWMVLLVHPDAPKDYSKDNSELQRDHIAHLTWL